MEIYLKKYFWVVHLLVVVTCAALLAKGVNHIVEANYLLGETPKKAATRPRAFKPMAPPKPAPSKDGEAVSSRNLFCSTCEPPKPDLPTLAPTPSGPVPTSLPLALLATGVARYGRYSSATILNTQTNRSGSYWLSEEIPDAGRIMAITPRWVEFENRSAGGRRERVDLLGAPPPGASYTSSVPPPSMPQPSIQPMPGGSPEADLVAELERGVRKIDDTRYQIERSLVDKVLTDPTMVARSARIVPSIKDGKANGFKMYAIRPNSVYWKLGFQNGDTIHSINGFEMTSPDKALEVYTKVKSATNLTVELSRRGQPVTMQYMIK
ncbi:MAG: hypothetical protein HY698_00495 [Deltaproteobacteria bacterium]|nr:hypothetical protein [Deltaproteobacteria bacterium]